MTGAPVHTALEAKALADQVAAMRADAEALEDEAWETGDLEDRLAMALEAEALRANADRLERRSKQPSTHE